MAFIHTQSDLDDALAQLTASYGQAWEARPSLRQWASVTDHVWFLQAMTADASLPCHDANTSSALKQLYDLLAARKFSPATTPEAPEVPSHKVKGERPKVRGQGRKVKGKKGSRRPVR